MYLLKLKFTNVLHTENLFGLHFIVILMFGFIHLAFHVQHMEHLYFSLIINTLSCLLFIAIFLFIRIISITQSIIFIMIHNNFNIISHYQVFYDLI